MLPERVVHDPEVLDLERRAAKAVVQLARAFFHREPPEAERDHLQVRDERVRRRGQHVPLRAVLTEVGLRHGGGVVDGFRGEI